MRLPVPHGIIYKEKICKHNIFGGDNVKHPLDIVLCYYSHHK
nr:MAG TPA: hypothetical protein [Caudoviricetes sp.]